LQANVRDYGLQREPRKHYLVSIAGRSARRLANVDQSLMTARYVRQIGGFGFQRAGLPDISVR